MSRWVLTFLMSTYLSSRVNYLMLFWFILLLIKANKPLLYLRETFKPCSFQALPNNLGQNWIDNCFGRITDFITIWWYINKIDNPSFQLFWDIYLCFCTGSFLCVFRLLLRYLLYIIFIMFFFYCIIIVSITNVTQLWLFLVLWLTVIFFFLFLSVCISDLGVKVPNLT